MKLAAQIEEGYRTPVENTGIETSTYLSKHKLKVNELDYEICSSNDLIKFISKK